MYVYVLLELTEDICDCDVGKCEDLAYTAE